MRSAKPWGLLALLALIPASAKAGEAPRIDRDAKEAARPDPAPLELHREHRFIWVLDRRKVGETVVRITQEEAPAGSPSKKIYHSSSRYRYERDGQSQRGEHDTYFDPSWKPLRYEWHFHWSGIKDYRSRQDSEGHLRGGRLSYTVIQNNDTRNPVMGELEVPADGYLYLSQAIDTWAILSGDLLREPRNYVAKVIYPDFIRVTEVTFSFEKEEPFQAPGDAPSAREKGDERQANCRVYSFRTREGDHAGKVWIDRRGRMVQYVQGPLKIYLEAGEAAGTKEADRQKSKVER